METWVLAGCVLVNSGDMDVCWVAADEQWRHWCVCVCVCAGSVLISHGDGMCVVWVLITTGDGVCVWWVLIRS